MKRFSFRYNDKTDEMIDEMKAKGVLAYEFTDPHSPHDDSVPVFVQNEFNKAIGLPETDNPNTLIEIADAFKLWEKHSPEPKAVQLGFDFDAEPKTAAKPANFDLTLEMSKGEVLGKALETFEKEAQAEVVIFTPDFIQKQGDDETLCIPYPKGISVQGQTEVTVRTELIYRVLGYRVRKQPKVHIAHRSEYFGKSNAPKRATSDPIGLAREYARLVFAKDSITVTSGNFTATIPVYKPNQPENKLQVITYTSDVVLEKLKTFHSKVGNSEYVTLTAKGIEGASLLIDYPKKVTIQGKGKAKFRTTELIDALSLLDNDFVSIIIAGKHAWTATNQTKTNRNLTIIDEPNSEVTTDDV